MTTQNAHFFFFSLQNNDLFASVGRSYILSSCEIFCPRVKFSTMIKKESIIQLLWKTLIWEMSFKRIVTVPSIWYGEQRANHSIVHQIQFHL